MKEEAKSIQITCPWCKRRSKAKVGEMTMCGCGTYLRVDENGKVEILPDNP